MTHVEQLREQARVLRTLASSFNDTRIRQQLIDIAAQCEADYLTESAGFISDYRAKPSEGRKSPWTRCEATGG